MRFFCFCVALLFLAHLITACGADYVYDVGDNVTCSTRRWYRGDVYFSGCTNGYFYRNPKAWKERRKCSTDLLSS